MSSIATKTPSRSRTLSRAGSSAGGSEAGPSRAGSHTGGDASMKGSGDEDEGEDSSMNGSSVGNGKGKEVAALDVPSEAELAECSTLGEEGEEDEDEHIRLGTVKEARFVTINVKLINTVKPGEDLELRRDPMNVAGKTAIELRRSFNNLKFAMVDDVLSKAIAAMLDAKLIEVKATANDYAQTTDNKTKKVTTGYVHTYDLEIWGKRSLGREDRCSFLFPIRNARLKKLAAKEAKATKAALERKLTAERKAKELAVIMADSELVSADDRPTGDVLAELFKEGGIDVASLPIHPCPPGKKDKTMRSELMTFQKQGLAWMINMEHPELPKTVEAPPVQLWVMKMEEAGKPYYTNLATGISTFVKPVLKRGGILADEMGLGKTLQMISLIVTDDTGEGVLETPEDPDERFDDMTLIVCPLSVASNWTDQFHHHIGSKRLKWHLYHGEGREVTRKQLRKCDVVITTYQTLAAERNIEDEDDAPAKKKSKATAADKGGKAKVENLLKAPKVEKPKEGLLHTIAWRRVVLDEGHVIKNPKAKMSMACASLKTERRWILTGTPIINSTNDLGAMIGFLRLCRPLDERENWMKYVQEARSEDGARLLRAIVSSTTLRRTKDMTDSNGQLLVSLPELTVYAHKVKLNPDTRAIYDEVKAVLDGIVLELKNKGIESQNYSAVLVFLLRLRQLACDPTLCPQSFLDMVRSRRIASELVDESKGPRVLDAREFKRLQSDLQTLLSDDPVCCICHEVPTEPRITPCKHVFCETCIQDHLRLQSKKCPVDHKPLDLGKLIGPAEDSGSADNEEEEVLAYQAAKGVDGSANAAKTRALIEILGASEAGVKSLVFSQWTSHLNCIEAALKNAGIVTVKFDGGMTQQKREAVIESFSSPVINKKPKKGDKGPPTVMLISLKAGALGLNLTCASQVFLMDPWWQASIEQQAIDRVYRIGQTRPVRVFQMVAEDTVEDKVVEIQTKKQALISQAFSGNKSREGSVAKPESHAGELAEIFGLKDE